MRQDSATLGITPKDRLCHGGQVYEIDGIRETSHGRGRYLEISTVTRIDQ